VFLLETTRLVLREFTMDDLDAIAEIRSDPEVMRFVGPGEARPRPRDDSRALIQWILGRYEAQGYGLWALMAQGENGGRAMGFCGLLDQNVEGRPELEIAYTLGRSFWGKGFATEAAIAVRDHAVGILGRTRLISLIYPENVASIRVAAKVGMMRERDVPFMGNRIGLYALQAGGPRP
jgi:[ribosomal protein S5]-alanine N-acetyltransferase